MDRMLGWLRIAGSRGWQLAGLALGIYVLWILFQKLMLMIVTIFVGLLIAALLVPVARWLEGLGTPRWASSLIAVLGGTLLLIGTATLIGFRVASQISELASQFEAVRRDLTSWLRSGPLDISEQQIQQSIEQVVSYVQNSWTAIASRVFGLVTLVGAFLTALILAFFLIRDTDEINGWILDRLVADDQRELVAAAGHRAGLTLQSYIQAVVIIGALDAFFIGLALVILGVPLAIPLALLTFFGAFFPVVGATVAGFLAALVALVSGGWVQALILVVVVIVVQQVDGNILQPVIMGRAVNLHPIVVLGVLSAGALLAGIVGAFLAVPFTAVLAAVANEVRERRDKEAVKAPEADRTPETQTAT